MSLTSGSSEYGRFDELAEEFAQRYRRGDRPSVEEYVDRLPEMADEIREMFPALVEVERVEADARDEALRQPVAVPRLRQIGDYRILREVGRGGMGVVYEAEQISLGRRVALKVLPGQAVGDRVVQERFRREARATAKLHHTNIVPVYEIGQDGDVRFYAMQFIDGQGLDDVITELRRLLDRARSSSGIKAATGGQSRWPWGEHDRPGIDTPTLGEGVEVGAVLRSILTGRFDPGDRAPDPARASPSMRASDTAGGLAAPTGTLTDSRVAGSDRALTRTVPGSATAEDATDPGPAYPPEPALSPSDSPVTTSAMLPGGTQLSSVESGRRAFFRSLAQIGRQVAGGLAYAHARGIIHRDIKPSNMLLDTEGVVWIADFGLAKGDDEGLTQSGDILGTLRYMAPERFRGEGDARADVYALGLTLYELLTLRPGFESSDRLRLIEQIKTEEPPRPRTIDTRIPRDLETIVLKAIEKDPKARYQTAEAIGEDLGRFLADEPIKARQVSAAERYWRWARRNPVIAVMGGVVTALLVAVTIGSMAAAAYFRESARRETNLAARELFSNQQSQRDRKDAIEARSKAIEERDHSRRLSAGLALDKGIALAQEGHADRGLLWMLQAMKTAPDDAAGFRKMVRWNLGAWLGQVHKTLRIIETGGPCDYLAFSPDGRSFATGFNPRDRSLATPIDLWDTASGRKFSSWPGAFAPFAFRPDGKVLLALDDQRRVVAIDLITRRVLWMTPPLPGELGETIAFSRDASTVHVTSAGGQIRWLLQLDASTGRQHGETIRSSGFVAAAPDGRIVATSRVESGKAYIDVLDLPSGRRTASWPADQEPNDYFVFSPDAGSLFVSQARGGVVNQNSYFGRIWDPGTGRPTTPPMTSTTRAIYPPSADRLMTLTYDQWLVRDAASGRVRGAGRHAGADPRLAAHPDGRTMLAASADGVVRLWQISPDAEPLPEGGTDSQASMTGIESDRRVRDVSLFWTDLWTDGQIAIAPATGVGGRELIRLSDPATGRPLGRPASHHPGWKIRSVALSPDGRCFATGSHPDGRVAGEVRLWDASTGRLRFPPMPHTNYVAALAFQPDGKVLAAGDFNGLVRLWDTSTGREIGRPLPQGEIVLSLAFSPDGKVLAAGLALDHTGKPGVRLWDTRTRQPIGELLPSTHHVTRIVFRPDGRALLADNGYWSNSPSTRLWDVTRGQAIGEPMIDEGSGGFRPDGRDFLTVGGDGTIKLRDAATGEVLASLLTASSRATCAAFRGDGGLVVAGFADGTVRLCDPATSQPVGPPRSMRHGVLHVAFPPDGLTVAAIDDFGESRTWPVPEPLQDESVDDLTLRIEARTGLRMETGLVILRLDNPAWRDRLERLGRRDPAAVRPDDDPAWHEPMIREAEQKGHTFAVLWHLDRLIASRPDDWSLYARRARAWSRSDKSDRFDKPAADYQQAERLGSREQLLDFQTQCVVDCTQAGRWAEALWYLDRLIAARPDDGSLHEDRAAVYGKLGREADRLAELARVFELVADEGLVIPRAEELGRAGRWAEAAVLLARCGRTGPLSRELAQAWVIACRKAGDRAGYREACAAFQACQGPNPTIVWNEISATSLFALGAEGLDDYQVPIGWCEKRLSANPAPRPLFRHIFSSALGALLLRAGRVDEAIVRLHEAITVKEVEIPTDWAYLALAHAEEGDFAECRRSLERLRSAGLDPSASFWDLQELALLRSEAESLLFDAVFPSDPFQSRRPR